MLPKRYPNQTRILTKIYVPCMGIIAFCFVDNKITKKHFVARILRNMIHKQDCGSFVIHKQLSLYNIE